MRVRARRSTGTGSARWFLFPTNTWEPLLLTRVVQVRVCSDEHRACIGVRTENVQLSRGSDRMKYLPSREVRTQSCLCVADENVDAIPHEFIPAYNVVFDSAMSGISFVLVKDIHTECRSDATSCTERFGSGQPPSVMYAWQNESQVGMQWCG